MQLSMAITDYILTVQEIRYDEDTLHLITIVSTFPDNKGNTKTQSNYVNDEDSAWEVVRDFVSEEPTGKFVELFPDYAP